MDLPCRAHSGLSSGLLGAAVQLLYSAMQKEQQKVSWKKDMLATRMLQHSQINC